MSTLETIYRRRSRQPHLYSSTQHNANHHDPHTVNVLPFNELSRSHSAHQSLSGQRNSAGEGPVKDSAQSKLSVKNNFVRPLSHSHSANQFSIPLLTPPTKLFGFPARILSAIASPGALMRRADRVRTEIAAAAEEAEEKERKEKKKKKEEQKEGEDKQLISKKRDSTVSNKNASDHYQSYNNNDGHQHRHRYYSFPFSRNEEFKQKIKRKSQATDVLSAQNQNNNDNQDQTYLKYQVNNGPDTDSDCDSNRNSDRDRKQKQIKKLDNREDKTFFSPQYPSRSESPSRSQFHSQSHSPSFFPYHHHHQHKHSIMTSHFLRPASFSTPMTMTEQQNEGIYHRNNYYSSSSSSLSSSSSSSSSRRRLSLPSVSSASTRHRRSYSSSSSYPPSYSRYSSDAPSPRSPSLMANLPRYSYRFIIATIMAFIRECLFLLHLAVVLVGQLGLFQKWMFMLIRLILYACVLAEAWWKIGRVLIFDKKVHKSIQYGSAVSTNINAK